MVATVLSLPEHFTTGRTEEELREHLTWAVIENMTGGQRARVAGDCERYDIMVQIRVDPEMLAIVEQYFPNDKLPARLPQSEREELLAAKAGLPVFAGGKCRAVTDEWRSFDIGFALSLYHDMREQPRYGSHWRTDVYRLVQAPDGSVGNMLMTESHTLPQDEDGKQRTLFHFRFDHEAPRIVVARS